MSSDQYSWRKFAGDFFNAAFLTALGYVLVEILRPGTITASFNLFILLGLTISLGIVFVVREVPFGGSYFSLLLVALFIGVIMAIVTPTAVFLKFIFGLAGFIAVLVFAPIFKNSKMPR